jgi:phenylalanyl-tRNA synthetase beta chain
MRLALSWLNEYVELTASVDDIAAALVRLGHEVEAIEYPRQSLEKVRVGHILSKEPHPNADRLSLLQVDIAAEAPLAIVCGASNMDVGDKIPVAIIGAALPNGMVIKKGKVRGETSFGMCCSEAELGLAEDAEGLLILPKDAPIGQTMGEFLQLETAIIDLSITPNRGDCMSVQGLARELAADFNVPLKTPAYTSVNHAADSSVNIRHDAVNDCPYYLARRIQGVTVSDSPAWLQARLVAAGQRPVNGVVDVLNYIMLDMGQPMHAFDAAQIDGDLHIRSALQGEGFDGLDDRHIDLNAGDLLIADDRHVLAMAGIMGSKASGVTASTTDIVLESAFFRPAHISLTRRTHGMVSEASMRFERGVDAAMVDVAMERASSMIIELFGGQASVVNRVGDATAWLNHASLDVSVERIAKRLGMPIEERIDAVLQRMGFAIERQDGMLHIGVPSWRHDVSLAEDLSEEYARIIGYDAIPAELPTTTMISTPVPRDLIAQALHHGFDQVISYAFVSPQAQRLFVEDAAADVVLQNPISEAMSVMRRSVWPGLLAIAQHNMNRQQKGMAVVEYGRTYEQRDGDFHEHNVMSWLMTGEVQSDTWHQKARNADFYDLKGAVEDWLQSQGVTPRMQAALDPHCGLQAGQVAEVRAGRYCVGRIARVDADLAASFDLDAPVYVAEINCDLLPEAKRSKFSPIPEYPSVERDLVFLLPDSTTADALLEQARKGGGNTVTDVRIFDVYRGQGIEPGMVSIGIRITMQDAKRTLQQDACDAIAATIIDNVSSRLKGQLR